MDGADCGGLITFWATLGTQYHMLALGILLSLIALLVALSLFELISRFNMGLVIASGLSIGTLFTLFVVPAVYLLIAADHSRQAAHVAPQVPTSGDAVRAV